MEETKEIRCNCGYKGIYKVNRDRVSYYQFCPTCNTILTDDNQRPVKVKAEHTFYPRINPT